MNLTDFIIVGMMIRKIGTSYPVDLIIRIDETEEHEEKIVVLGNSFTLMELQKEKYEYSTDLVNWVLF